MIDFFLFIVYDIIAKYGTVIEPTYFCRVHKLFPRNII